MRMFYCAVLTLYCFSACTTQRKINPVRLKEDFDFAVQKLKLQHQGFYNYVDTTETDLSIADLRKEIDTPMTKLQFYQLMRQLLVLMHEGHGSIDLPKATMLKIGITKSFLPIAFQFFNKELIVTQNYGTNVEGFVQGAKVIAINGEAVTQIMENFKKLIATDGFNETSKYEWVDGINFSLLYRLAYGKKKEFNVEFIDPNDKQIRNVKLSAIRYLNFKSKNRKFPAKNLVFNSFTFKLINDSIVYWSIPSFGEEKIEYESYYKNKFKLIDSLKIKHLIIDIQANGGGKEGNENLLFNYLYDKKFKKYSSVTLTPDAFNQYSQKKKIEMGFENDKWTLKEGQAERGEFTLYNDYYGDLAYKNPDTNFIYKNNVYVLISGYTFSGGAEFASLVKMKNRGLFIGEETGGAYEGNVSGYFRKIKLPHTKIKIDIPLVFFHINVTPKVKGRGVMPDYEVPQTWEDYLKELNSKLEFAKKIILQ